MDNSVPEIFDRNLQKRQYERSASQLSESDFLLRHMAENINERLLDINRKFENALLITPLPAITKYMPSLRKKTTQFLTAAPSKTLQPDMVIDEENPNLTPQKYELIISIGSLHLINDLPGALIQLRHALKPDGLLLASFFGGETLTELRQAFAAAEVACGDDINMGDINMGDINMGDINMGDINMGDINMGDINMGDINMHVHPFGELQTLGSLLQRAGFAMPVADSDSVIVRYREPIKLLHDLRKMGQNNSLTARPRRFLRRATLAACLAIYQEKFADPDGKVTARFDIHTLSGWSPHKSQQQPLKPGSAKLRLADALGTKEKKL